MDLQSQKSSSEMVRIADEMQLLGLRESPFVMRVRITLNLKGVPYEFQEETFGSKSELLLKSNPVYKKVPVLIHNGKPMAESMVIVEYIDEAWSSSGHSILPTDPYERAVARFWAVYIADKMVPAIFGTFRRETKEAKEEAAKQVFDGLLLLEEVMAKCSNSNGKGGFFGGDNIGYLDIALGGFVGWIVAVGKMCGIKFLDEEKTPLLVGWAERFLSNEAVREVIHKTEVLVEFGKMLQARLGPAATTPAK